MDTPILQTFGITHRFGNVQAVSELDLHVPPGSVYGTKSNGNIPRQT